MKETLLAWYEHKVKDKQRTDRLNKVKPLTKANAPLFNLLETRARARSISIDAPTMQQQEKNQSIDPE